jgi:hypothetical protein
MYRMESGPIRRRGQMQCNGSDLAGPQQSVRLRVLVRSLPWGFDGAPTTRANRGGLSLNYVEVMI